MGQECVCIYIHPPIHPPIHKCPTDLQQGGWRAPRYIHPPIHRIGVLQTYSKGVGGRLVRRGGEEVADADGESVVVGAVDEELLQPPGGGEGVDVGCGCEGV